LLTGSPPYAATNGIAAVVAAHLTAPPPILSARVSGFSPRLDGVIATAMAKDPGQRFSSAREFAAAAADALEDAAAMASQPLPGSAVAPYVSRVVNGPDQAPQQGVSGPHSFPPALAQQAPGRHGAWILMAVALISAVVLITVWAALFVRSRHAAAPTVPPTAAVPTVSVADVDGLLLPSQRAAEIVGAPELFVLKDISHLVDEAAAVHLLGKDADCIGAFLPAEEFAYRTSKWSAVRRKDLSAGDGPDVFLVSQAVVVFPDADAARRALDAQIPQWSACVGRTVTARVEGKPPDQTTFGAVTNSGATLSMIQIRDGIADSGCQRAMTALENAVIDVDACRFNLANEGIGVLKAIAARIKARV
jgi:eukaryotic-like serine/threonine-protein kinase